ncbi:MAG: DNA-processing protein DprA [Clostridia bacterium]|nr:DNA-processing protein DprA [Clostridia bacterium]
MEQHDLWLWLAASGITPRQFARLMEVYGSVEGIDKALGGFSVREGALPVSATALRKLREARRPAAMNDVERAMKRADIRLVARDDAEYPPLLRHLDEDAPIALFVRGQAELRFPRAFAIVGTRRCTRYGALAAERIAAGLGAAGVAVVSGLARGVDTAAHLGCLSVGGSTVAVLGCGADIVYPRENEELLRRILDEGGAVVSEYAPGVQPLGRHFPVRNRIISGMCSGVLIVEASVRSGAKHTVDHAQAQGREVYALPGPVDTPTSEMPLILLRDGSQMATSAGDILESIRWLGDDGETCRGDYQSPAPLGRAIDNRPYDHDKTLAGLDPAQRQVAQALKESELTFSEIVACTGFSAPELNSYLTLLELHGIIIQLPGRIFALAR